MRSANYVEETTTSIAGTSGDGAITLTAVTNVPRFSTVFGTQATTLRYVIEDTVNKKFETGIGSVASNVLTRTKPQVTWDGTTYDDSTPAALQFGATPTSGNIKIRLSATAESQGIYVPPVQTTIAGASDWQDYQISAHYNAANSFGSQTIAANTEYYVLYRLEKGGTLTGKRINITSGTGNIKQALYSLGSNGLPNAKIVEFTALNVASTGNKTDTATGSWSPAGEVRLVPGWYAVGIIADAVIGVTITNGSNTVQTPFGRVNTYGDASTVTASGSYATGLPATPTPTAMPANSGIGSGILTGLKVIA